MFLLISADNKFGYEFVRQAIKVIAAEGRVGACAKIGLCENDQQWIHHKILRSCKSYRIV